MERASEASFRRETRIPDFHGDYVSPGGYSSSLSLYSTSDLNPVTRDSYGSFSDPLSRVKPGPLGRDGLGIKDDYTGPSSYGGYSYSSSFDDMRKNSHERGYSYSGHFEESKSYGASTAYGKYDYGSDKTSSLHESYRGPSSAPYYKSHLGFDGLLASSSPHASDLYRDNGQNLGTRHQDLSCQQNDDSYQAQYDYSSLNTRNVASLHLPASEQSPALWQRSESLRHYDLTYPANDTRSIADTAPDYEQASGLSRKYGSSLSGMLPTYGASGDWRDASGRLYDSGNLLGNVHEPYAHGRSANGSRVGDGSFYTDPNKFGVWDGGIAKKALPEIRKDENISGLLSCGENNEWSTRMLGVDVGREGTGKKKRQSRWEPVEENEKNGENGSEKKKRKSRWSEEKPQLKLPDFLTGEDSELIALRTQLIIINRKLQSGQVIDDRLEAERSPSPQPVFDNFGYQVNTREYRARERLTKERQRIMATLSEKSSTFKPLPDFKQPKFSRKISIPVDKYPDYNFVGLIIGPRGNTQKKMEKESGAKIFIRGKGSIREGLSTLTGLNETENLHVLIEADAEESIDKAADMVEKLLVPLGDDQNEHKRAQLRELASLNGTLRSNEVCQVSQEAGHVAKDYPMASSTASSSAAAAQKVDTSHDKNQVCNVCKKPGHLSKECPSTRPIPGSALKGGSVGSGGVQVAELHPGLNNNENDNTLVYVAFLPLSVIDTQLRSLFAPFGKVVQAKVMRHLTTGISKSYGFVKFINPADAAQAVALMDGYKLDGKVLSVKLKIDAGAVS